MKLLTKAQIYEGDALTAKSQNISSTELMERAGNQIFNWIHTRMQGAQVPVHVFCGIGNNGGNGMVLARHLTTHGYNVFTYIVNYSDKRSKDFLVNYDRLKNTTKNWPSILTCEADFPEIHSDDIIIDAVFGIGLNRKPTDWVIKLFNHFKLSKAFTLAIDLPSGLFTDKALEHPQDAVFANYTLSFQTPKLIFFLPKTARYTTQWEVIDIGIDRNYLQNIQADSNLIGKLEVLPMYQPREKFAHKGHFGHALLIGGSYGKIGAAQLASKAALLAGAGLVSAYIPKCGYHSMQTAVPEIMVITDENDTNISAINYTIHPTVIGIGIGLGTNQATQNAFKTFLKTNTTPLVIDADGINALAEDKSLLQLLPAESVITPHEKELKGLVGEWQTDFEKLEKVKVFSTTYKLIVVIKGAHTITVNAKAQYINTTGNPGMATAGTGDVLTGVITGLIAQGYAPLQAALFGVYLHGKAADIAVESTGYQSLIASHINNYLGEAFIDLFKQPEQPQVEQHDNDEPKA